MKDDVFKAIYDEAETAGITAGNNAIPTPMVVGTPTTPFGNDIDTTKKVYVVNDGVCGFAWVNIRPATSKFARWCKKNGKGRTDSYAGGLTIWCHHFNQSMRRKEAWASAFAKVLQKYEIKAYMESRMD
jgi:hypothetical protein